MDTAILAVSYGTTDWNAVDGCILPIEREFAQRNPECYVYRAFTSKAVLDKLENKGVTVDNVTTALEKIYEKGFRKVIVQPTLITEGVEYEKMCTDAEAFRSRLDFLAVGKTLLKNEGGLSLFGKAIAEEYKIAKNECIILFAHGTLEKEDDIYGKLEAACQKNGIENLIVGTMKGKPNIDDVIAQMIAKKYQKALIVPLMVTAGSHVKRDMASESENSLKLKLKKEGLNADLICKGIGEIPAIRSIYCDNLRNAKELLYSKG